MRDHMDKFHDQMVTGQQIQPVDTGVEPDPPSGALN